MAGYPRRTPQAARALTFAPAGGSQAGSRVAGWSGVAQGPAEDLRSPATSDRKVLHSGKWGVAGIEDGGAAPATAHGTKAGVVAGPPAPTADPEVLHRGSWEAAAIAAEPAEASAEHDDSKTTPKTSIKAVLKDGSWAGTVRVLHATVSGASRYQPKTACQVVSLCVTGSQPLQIAVLLAPVRRR